MRNEEAAWTTSHHRHDNEGVNLGAATVNRRKKEHRSKV